MKTSIIVLAASAVLGCVGLAVSQGCTSSTSDPGDDTGPDSTPTVDDCTDCLAQTCRPETERCAADPGCQAILFCIEEVNEAGSCLGQQSASSRCLYEQLADCQVTRECDQNNTTGCSMACENTVNPQCPVPDAGDGGLDAGDGGDAAVNVTVAVDCPTGDISAATTCDTCATANCAAQEKACLTTNSTLSSPTYDTVCNELEACRSECKDTACIGRCNNGYATGKPMSDAFDACLQASCATECAAPAASDAGVGDAGVSDAGNGGD